MGDYKTMLRRTEGESVEDFHKRLMEEYGCEGCSELGNNGCGWGYIDGYYFETEDYMEEVEHPEYWTCYRTGRKASLYPSVEKQRQLTKIDREKKREEACKSVFCPLTRQQCNSLCAFLAQEENVLLCGLVLDRSHKLLNSRYVKQADWRNQI